LDDLRSATNLFDMVIIFYKYDPQKFGHFFRKYWPGKEKKVENLKYFDFGATFRPRIRMKPHKICENPASILLSPDLVNGSKKNRKFLPQKIDFYVWTTKKKSKNFEVF